jgi:GNAT superfamily N-acetyltransferase
MYYRESGQISVPDGVSQPEYRREQLRALTEAGPPPGLLGYRDGQPVGWVTLGPRDSFAKLARSPVLKPVDATPVWSVLCFVVPKAQRRQGVASGLLAAAIEHARRGGAAVLEAYPVDKAGPTVDEWLWFGTLPMYQRAGFVEVARRKPQRPIVRLALRGG